MKNGRLLDVARGRAEPDRSNRLTVLTTISRFLHTEAVDRLAWPDTVRELLPSG